VTGTPEEGPQTRDFLGGIPGQPTSQPLKVPGHAKRLRLGTREKKNTATFGESGLAALKDDEKSTAERS